MSVPTKAETEIEPAGVGEQRSGVRRLFDRLTGKSTIALIDQAITSGANFAAVVVVGRAAGADDLGVYSLGFTLLMLVSAAQESLVSSPYTFYSHRVDGDDRAKLAGSSLVHAMGLMLIAVVSLVGVAALMGRSPLADVLWILAAMTPFLLAREYARKFAFAELRMSAALALDASAAGLQIGGLLWLASTGNLSASTAFLATGSACGLSAAMWFFGDRGRFRIRRDRIVRDWLNHWQFGRWVFAGVVTILLHINIVRWLIAFGIDDATAGIFAACMAIAMLASPFIQGMNNVLMPRAAKAFHQDGPAAVARIVWRTTGYVLCGMAVFAIVTFLGGDWVVTRVYGEDYSGNHAVVCVLVVFMISRAIDTSLYNGIWSLEHPQTNVRINLIAMSVTALLATMLMSLWGMFGAALGLLFGDLCGSGLRAWAFLSLVGEQKRYRSSLELGAE